MPATREWLARNVSGRPPPNVHTKEEGPCRSPMPSCCGSMPMRALSFRELAAGEQELADKLAPALAERLSASITQSIATSDKLREAAGDIGTITLPEDVSRPLWAVTAEVVREAIGAKALADDPSVLDEIAALETKVEGTVADVVGVDEPLRTLPGLGSDLLRARAHSFAKALGLPATTATALGELVALTALTETNLAGLVEAGTLTVEAARRAGTALALYDLFDEREELVQAFAAEASDPVALTSLPIATWRDRIVASGTIPVGGMSEDEYAELLSAKIDERFRTSVDDFLKELPRSAAPLTGSYRPIHETPRS